MLVTAPEERETPETPPGDPTAFGAVLDASRATTSVETLSDLLADSVGVRVRRFGGLGDFSTVSVRGFSAGQVQVYLDGVPLSRADNETVNLSDLPLDLVDRVEIYRSATPLAFAQSAPGGVVNVVTREPPAGEPLWAASASGESFGTRKVDLAHGARTGRWDYLGFVHYLGSEGDFEFTNDLGTTDNPSDDRRETRENNAFNQVDVLGRLRYHGDGGRTATITSDTFWKDEGVPGAGSVQALDTQLRTTRQRLQLTLSEPSLAALPVALDGQVYELFEHTAFDDPEGEILFAPTKSRQDMLATGGQLVAHGALGTHQVLGGLAAVGYERFTSEELEQSVTEPARTRVRGTIAGEDEILLFAEHLAIVPQLRWEIVRDAFPGQQGVPEALDAGGTQVRDEWEPRLGVRVEPLPWMTLLGNLARAVRFPNLEELFGTRGVVVGNPALQPETATLRDVGARLSPPAWGPFDGLALEYAYFDNAIDDLIVFVQNSQRLVRPENVSSATVRGHEVSARARVWRRLGWTLNYTHQDARDDSDVTFLRGNQLPGRPADEVYARCELAWGPGRPLGALTRFPGSVFFDVNAIADDYLDRANTERVGSRLLYGVGVTVGLPGAALRPLRLGFEVRNLTDDQTRDALGFPLPGRVFSGTVSWGFGPD